MKHSAPCASRSCSRVSTGFVQAQVGLGRPRVTRVPLMVGSAGALLGDVGLRQP